MSKRTVLMLGAVVVLGAVYGVKRTVDDIMAAAADILS